MPGRAGLSISGSRRSGTCGSGRCPWSTLEEGREPTLDPLAVDVLHRGDTEILVCSSVDAGARLRPSVAELHGQKYRLHSEVTK